MSATGPTGSPRPSAAETTEAAHRLGERIAALVAELRPLAPAGSAGTRALAALDRLLERPAASRPAALASAFATFVRACADGAPDPDATADDLRAFVRMHHAELLAIPQFAGVVEQPRRQAQMLAWLLDENVSGLERARGELRLRDGEIARLRAELERIDAEKLAVEAHLQRSRALADRGLAAAGLAHDFANLLQAILGHAALVRERLPTDGPDHEALTQVERAAQRAAELSRGLARWERDPTPQARPLDLSALVAEVLDLLAASSPHAVHEERVLPPELPPVTADATDLRRIVLNLVMNAWQALGAARGTVRVRTGTTDSPAGAEVFVEVEDDGPGMDDDVRARVFEPFFSTRAGGCGIGLPNVRRLAERWGGRVEVWSTRGEGTRFRVSFPAPAGDGEHDPGA